MIEDIVLDAFSELTGLDKEFVNKIREMNLFKEGILDSLSLVNLLTIIEEKTNNKIDIYKCKVEDFLTINSIIKLVENYKG